VVSDAARGALGTIVGPPRLRSGGPGAASCCPQSMQNFAVPEFSKWQLGQRMGQARVMKRRDARLRRARKEEGKRVIEQEGTGSESPRGTETDVEALAARIDPAPPGRAADPRVAGRGAAAKHVETT
jgi:hypothetical protein